MKNKNIHLIPTDKPTWLHKSTLTGVLRKSSSCIDDMKQAQGMNIYITSDEEIKEGDWRVTKFGDILKVGKPENGYEPTGKKIILTTDQDLIKDGVQAIDDEFLEWFVKNPSYEEVEVIPLRKSSGWYDEKNVCRYWDFLTYKIIIPKEEPTIEEEYLKDELKKYDGIGVVILNKPEEPNPFKNMLPLTKIDWEKFKKNPIPSKKEEPKQESLEEAKIKHTKFCIENKIENPSFSFDKGAKWQQERMYSEEDMEDYSNYCWKLSNDNRYKTPLSPKEWFEQFKKK